MTIVGSAIKTSNMKKMQLKKNIIEPAINKGKASHIVLFHFDL